MPGSGPVIQPTGADSDPSAARRVLTTPLTPVAEHVREGEARTESVEKLPQTKTETKGNF